MTKIVKLGLLFEGGLALLALLLGWALDLDPLVRARAELLPIVYGLLATGPMLAGLLALERASWAPLAKLRALIEQELAPMFAGSAALGLLLLSASAGIGEELLFRGLLQEGLSGWLGAWAGLVIASLLFGLAHFISTSYFVLASVIGLYLGGLYIATDSLWAPVIAHGLYDFLALMYITRR